MLSQTYIYGKGLDVEGKCHSMLPALILISLRFKEINQFKVTKCNAIWAPFQCGPFSELIPCIKERPRAVHTNLWNRYNAI